jgi:hypothetical protein
MSESEANEQEEGAEEQEQAEQGQEEGNQEAQGEEEQSEQGQGEQEQGESEQGESEQEPTGENGENAVNGESASDWPDGAYAKATSADDYRKVVLGQAIDKINGLLDKKPPSDDDSEGGSGVPDLNDEDRRILRCYTKWMLASDWDTVIAARDLMTKSRAITVSSYAWDPSRSDAFLWVTVNTPDNGVNVCSPFTSANETSRREGMTHEYFHFFGAGHYRDTTDPSEAIQCAHRLTELVFDVATGCTLACEGFQCGGT